MTKSSRAAKAQPQAEAGQLAVVEINDTPMQVIEYGGRRVVTLAQVDTVHRRHKGTARKRFNDNRARLVEGEDFFEITQASEFRTLGLERPQGGTSGKVVLLAETGYLMLAKSLTDDLAWQVQRKLVNSYFRHRQAPEQAKPIPYSVGKNDSLNKAEQDGLRDTIFRARDRLPSEHQAEFTTKAWSKLKAHFHYGAGENYRHIPRTQFGEALALIERHIAEFEPSGKAPAAIGYTPPNVLDALVAASNALAQTVPVLAELAGREAANDPHRAGRRAV